jgi:type II secretory pathway pseudopilin PulG
MRLTIAPFNERRRTDGGSRGHLAVHARRGYSLLEVQVGFAMLGIGLAGLCPLVVMQLRQVRVLEQRLQGQVVHNSWTGGTSTTMLTAQTYYLVPWQNPMTQKLAGAAQVVAGSSTIPCDPGPLIPLSSAPLSSSVNVIELDATPGSQTVTAYVDVSAP